MWANLYHHSRVLPLARVVSCLVLYGDVVPWLEWRERLASLRELFTLLDVSLCISIGSVFSSLSPLRSGLELPRL